VKLHLIAIGGTGMGALAGLLKSAGHEVRGSDTALYPPMSDQLEALGIEVASEFRAENLEWGPDAVVVGNVCRKDNPEVVAAQERGLPLKSMPQVLGEELLASRTSLVIAGTHGKTTTASLTATALMAAGRDPSCFIGGVVRGLGAGWRLGDGEEFVVEGDEYDSAFFDKGSKFLHYGPKIAVLTSVELDHVDIFSSMEAVREAFRRFVRLIPEDGLLVASADSEEALALSRSEARCPVQSYSVREDAPEGTTWVARGIRYHPSGRCEFDVHYNGEPFVTIETALTGHHNIGNALAAIAVASAVGVERPDLRSALSSFAGVARRQELRGIARGVYVLDDYGHHPTAIARTLEGLRNRFPGRRLIALYEPRTATSRRRTFQRDFVDAFAHADQVLVGALHDPSKIPEEERFDPARLALDLHQGGTPAAYLNETEKIVAETVERARPGDVVVVFSSGSFDGIHGKLLAALGDAIVPANGEHVESVRHLLSSLELDYEDVSDGNISNFLVLQNENGFVGCVGIELFGDDAVLRSLAVEQGGRGVGYGWMLADTAISQARFRGVKRLYLMTDNASDFFAAKHGFRVVDLSTVADEIIASPTFVSGSSDTVAMRLDL